MTGNTLFFNQYFARVVHFSRTFSFAVRIILDYAQTSFGLNIGKSAANLDVSIEMIFA